MSLYLMPVEALSMNCAGIDSERSWKLRFRKVATFRRSANQRKDNDHVTMVAWGG